MTRKIDPADLPEFDLAEYLDSEEAISEYLNQIIADGDMAELAHALGVAARARGMTEVAKASGITREALYKALRPDASPRFETVSKVCAALGVRLVAQPIHRNEGIPGEPLRPARQPANRRTQDAAVRRKRAQEAA